MTATDITAGGQHTCAVANGNVWCWGANSNGQLGDGTTSNRMAPVYVRTTDGQPLTQVSKIVAGYRHTCALVTTTVWCWGENSQGQLGNGGTTQSLYAVPVRTSDGDILSGVSQVSSKYNTVCVVKTGTVWCWGSTMVYPTQVLSTLLTAVSRIGVGWNSSCAVQNGYVKCWTNGQPGTLGQDSSNPNGYVVYSDGYFQSILTGVTTLDVGGAHTCAQATVGVVCWGSNSTGQLGRQINIDCCSSTYAKKVSSYSAVGQINDINMFSLGSNFTCGITGILVTCWGANSSGQVGNGQKSYNSESTTNAAQAPVYT
ncbi:MAG: RCC1 domain-containing protein, partial [Roseiflexaceae bacterium]